MAHGLVIGGGPAGLAAAEVMAARGLDVTIADAMPSMGRKFLMAGKSGLNLTFDAVPPDLLKAYGIGAERLAAIVSAHDAQAVQAWAEGLGQPVFTGSSGRVFPVAMKASPLLRAWFQRLDDAGVVRKTKWRWDTWEDNTFGFQTPDGVQTIRPDVTVLALGGGSWRRLGSDGMWRDVFETVGLRTEPFLPSNAGLVFSWSDHMARHFGAPLKNVVLTAGEKTSVGELVISQTGLEGGALYPMSAAIRAGSALKIDLMPQRDQAWIADKLYAGRSKDSLTNRLRKAVGLPPVKIALLREWARPLPADPLDLAKQIKSLDVPRLEFRPLDEAISTVGGVPWSALNPSLMLPDRPGVFCAGEMVDWDAPTGGYLLTACFAMGRWAGAHAARFALAA